MSTGIPSRPMSVLVLDDDPLMRRLLQQHCRDRGFVVHEAESAEAALELLERTKIEIALIDLGLPGLSGLDLLERLDAETPLLQRIVITSCDSMSNLVACLRRGALAFLAKPVLDPQLIDEALDIAVAIVTMWWRQLARAAEIMHEDGGENEQEAGASGKPGERTSQP